MTAGGAATRKDDGMNRKSLVLASVFCLAAGTAQADPLRIVQVFAPAFNTLFDASGSIVVQDSVSTFALSGTTGLARLKTRTTVGQPGTPAAGQYMYAYRLDLEDVRLIDVIACIEALTLTFGPVTSTLDYDFDGVTGDEVFVLFSRGGGISPSSAVRTGSSITFRFGSPQVCSGGGSIPGENTYFFGLTSRNAPRFVTATIQHGGGPTYYAAARAARAFVPVPSDWIGRFRPLPGAPNVILAALQITTTRAQRFGGTIMIDDPLLGRALSIGVDGKLSASGQLAMSGASVDGRLVAHGRETPLGEGGALDARLRVKLTDGRELDGTLLLRRAVDPIDAPKVISEWTAK
jgi:hypothetical protein